MQINNQPQVLLVKLRIPYPASNNIRLISIHWMRYFLSKDIWGFKIKWKWTRMPSCYYSWLLMHGYSWKLSLFSLAFRQFIFIAIKRCDGQVSVLHLSINEPRHGPLAGTTNPSTQVTRMPWRIVTSICLQYSCRHRDVNNGYCRQQAYSYETITFHVFNFQRYMNIASKSNFLELWWLMHLSYL